jgi:hypothetical protein
MVTAPMAIAGSRPATANAVSLRGSGSAATNVPRRNRNAVSPTIAVATTKATSTTGIDQSMPASCTTTAVDAISAMLVTGASPQAAMPRRPSR